jgi:hypothetical protein
MIQYLPGWTYINKRGVRSTLIAVDVAKGRVKHCRNSRASAFVISETSLKNFQRWTDETRTLKLHKQIAALTPSGKVCIVKRNADYLAKLAVQQWREAA